MKKHIAKKAAVLSVAGMMAVTALTGCGSKGDKNASARKVIEYDINDYVKLGQYTGLDVTEEITAVTDEDVQSRIDSLIESNTTYEDVTDRNIATGDKVTVDYTRNVEGEEPVEKTDYELVIGDAVLGEKFDDTLINLTVGNTVSFTVQEQQVDTENDETTETDVNYSVTVKSVKQPVVPELTDEFIAVNSDYDTVEAYKEATRAEMEESNADSAKNSVQAELLNTVIDGSEVSGCPPFIYNMNYNAIAQSYALYGSYFGGDLETYMSAAGITFEDIQKQAVEMTKQTLVIEAIVKDAGIDVTDEQFDENLNTYVENYGYTSKEEVLEKFSREELLFDLRRDVAIDYLYENNNVTQVVNSDEE